MSTLVLTATHQSLFSIFKQNLRKKIFEAPQAQPKTNSTNDTNQEILKCKKCDWTGKEAETKKKYLLFAETLETEHFCPRCNSYIGFRGHKNQ